MKSLRAISVSDRLAALAGIAAAVASIAGFIPGVYRDPQVVIAQSHGFDIGNLIGVVGGARLAVPFFIFLPLLSISVRLMTVFMAIDGQPLVVPTLIVLVLTLAASTALAYAALTARRLSRARWLPPPPLKRRATS